MARALWPLGANIAHAIWVGFRANGDLSASLMSGLGYVKVRLCGVEGGLCKG
jgi:hypothetical protein